MSHTPVPAVHISVQWAEAGKAQHWKQLACKQVPEPVTAARTNTHQGARQEDAVLSACLTEPAHTHTFWCVHLRNTGGAHPASRPSFHLSQQQGSINPTEHEATSNETSNPCACIPAVAHADTRADLHQRCTCNHHCSAQQHDSTTCCTPCTCTGVCRSGTYLTAHRHHLSPSFSPGKL
jgi:hypothetical protein